MTQVYDDEFYEEMPIQPYVDVVIEVVRLWFNVNGKHIPQHSYRACRNRRVISHKPTLELLHKDLVGTARRRPKSQAQPPAVRMAGTSRRKRWND